MNNSTVPDSLSKVPLEAIAQLAEQSVIWLKHGTDSAAQYLQAHIQRVVDAPEHVLLLVRGAMTLCEIKVNKLSGRVQAKGNQGVDGFEYEGIYS